MSVAELPGEPGSDGPSAPGEIPIPPFPDRPIVPTDGPVLVSGTGGVSDSGQSTYSIPLWLPDGPAGMEPTLSIAYSGSANGRMGVGWNVSGLSSISPCSQTAASEGVIDGVDFDDTDAYCLDGQKLVLDPDATQIAVKKYYRTEIESFQRIRGLFAGNEAQQPDQFIVETRDGRTLTYEPLLATRRLSTDGDEDPQPDGEVAVIYPIASAVDKHGNTIRYSYDESTDSGDPLDFSYRISEVNWSYAGLGAARRKVRFVYETSVRPDPISRFRSDVHFVDRHRLVAIEAHAPNPSVTEKMWTYHFEYEVSVQTGRSRLDNVKLCDLDGACSWNKEIGWTGGQLYIKQEHIVSEESEFNVTSLSRNPLAYATLQADDALNFYPPTDVRLMVLDANSDGIDDILYRTKATLLKTSSMIEANPGMTLDYIPGEIRLRLSSKGAPLADMSDVTSVFEPTWWQAHLGKTRVADLDDDGENDLLVARTQVTGAAGGAFLDVWEGLAGGYLFRGHWKFGYTRQTTFPWDPAKAAVFDEVSVKSGVYREGPNGGFSVKLFTPPWQRALADLDGDGRVDHVDAFPMLGETELDLTHSYLVDADWGNYQSKDQPRPYRYALASDPNLKLQFPWDRPWSCNNGSLTAGDFNGDGRQELLVASDTQKDEDGPIPGNGLYDRFFLADHQGGLGYEANFGSTSELRTTDCGQFNPDLVFGDFNGDGLTDALYPPQEWENNTEPLVRWNYGNGFGPLQSMPTTGGPSMTALMHQPLPTGKDQEKVPWDRGTRVVDLDDDGRSDIVAFRLVTSGCHDNDVHYGCSMYKTIVAVYLSRGDHFEGFILDDWVDGGVSLSEGFTTAQVGDVTGDGYADIVHVLGDGTIAVLELAMDGDATDRVEYVRDMGSPEPSHSFEYMRGDWGPTQPGECAWPTGCIRRSFTVVSKHTQFAGTDDAGKAMRRTQTHAYEKPRVSRVGRGFLGFSRRRVWDRELGRHTLSERNFDYVDPNPNSLGAIFYPFGVTHTEVTIPLASQPSEAEIDSTSMAPGFSGPENTIKLRVVESTLERELRFSSDNRILTILTANQNVDESEVNGHTNPAARVPAYLKQTGSPLRESTSTYAYDAYGNMTSEVHATVGGTERGRLLTYDNRTGSQWLLGLPTMARSWSGDPTTVPTLGSVDPRRVVRTTYNATGSPDTVVIAGQNELLCPSPFDPTCDAVETTTTYTYDGYGNITSASTEGRDESELRTISYEWDHEGIYRTRTTNALGYSSVVLKHPALGVAVLAQDHLGTQATAKVDGFGRLRSTTRPGTPQLTRTYAEFIDGNRRGIRSHDSATDGSEMVTTFDELGRAVVSEVRAYDGSLLVTAREFNTLGAQTGTRRPGINYPSPYLATARYDRLGRVLESTGADGTTTTFQHSFFESSSVDPEGHHTYVKRDIDGRVIESGHLVNGSPYGEVTFDFGAFDQVEAITDSDGNVTSMAYDALGRRTQLVDPNSGTQTSSYNGFGETKQETSAGNGDVSTFTYDVLGRVTQSEGPDGVTLLTWDGSQTGALQLAKATSPDGIVTEYKYDSLGRQRRVEQTVDGAIYVVEQSYDQFGRPKQLFYPKAPGHKRFAIQYRYGPHGYPSAIDDITKCDTIPVEPGQFAPTKCPPNTPDPIWSVLTRDRDALVASSSFGNGIGVIRARDNATGRLTSTLVTTTPVVSTSYTYDDDGNLESRVTGGLADHFAYDDLHRITGWNTTENFDPEKPGEPSQEWSYRYDELGNLDTVTSSGASVFTGVFGNNTGPHQLSSSNYEPLFTYDGRGRQETGGDRTTVWSQYDLPHKITTSTSTTDYTYDFEGRRVAKQVAGAGASETTYMGSLYERRFDGNGVTHVYLVSGETGPVAQVEYSASGQSKRYLVTDVVGSVTTVLDESGAVVEQSRFSPFGHRVDPNNSPMTDPHLATTVGFGGHEEEANSLVNMGGRIYDRRQYRFLSPDPIVAAPLFGQSHNPYSYVLNNPLRYADPTGLTPEPVEPQVPEPDPDPPGTIYLQEDHVESRSLCEISAGYCDTDEFSPDVGTDRGPSSSPAEPAPLPDPVPSPTGGAGGAGGADNQWAQGIGGAPVYGPDANAAPPSTTERVFMGLLTVGVAIVGAANPEALVLAGLIAVVEGHTTPEHEAQLVYAFSPIIPGSQLAAAVDSGELIRPPVRPGDRGSYGALKSRKRKSGETEPMDMDHQPSFAAQARAKEQALGRPLSKSERAKLKRETPAVASPRSVHQKTSPTYGGRNNSKRIAGDAADLEAAAARDRAAFDEAMKKR